MIDAFFAYARERHAIHLRRAAGQPPPWTEDPVLQRYRFCNVFRELDKTTMWFAENVRDPMRNKPDVLLATVLFRLFNRITTGEAIFKQRDLITGESSFDIFFTTKFPVHTVCNIIKSSILTYCQPGPYVTGSFMVKTPTGKTKLDGVLWIVEQFASQRTEEPHRLGWRDHAELMIKRKDVTLEAAWEYLRGHPFIGDFQAYEFVTDLRWTDLLSNAQDICTWANPGPGAKRGLKWVFGEVGNRQWQIEKMRELLEMSRDPKHWPQPARDDVAIGTPEYDYGLWFDGDWKQIDGAHWGDWPSWEMRDVEHTLCEFDKFTRVQHGGAAPRGRMRYG